MHAERSPTGMNATAAALALAGRPGLLWLDGDPGHGAGRWSFVASDPVERRVAAAGDPDPFGRLPGPRAAEEGAREGPPPSRVPRWAGYVAYDASRPAGAGRRPAQGGRPALWLGRYDALLAYDHEERACFLVGDDDGATGRLRARLEAGRGRPGPEGRVLAPPRVAPRADHARAIEAALGHIAAGDIYQVNLARRWVAPWAGDPLALWLAMREASPVPLGLYLDAGDHAVLARTMETFLDWEGPGRGLATRPIKGTIARSGLDDGGDASALRADPKEQAELAMIVDLMRNDLGRVARTGTVRVVEHLAVEPYAKLSHLVSTVACTTREDVGLREILAATFPPGSVTGAPKIRAMQIIEALEPRARGVYCGCVGIIDRAGGARWAVAIRTAQVGSGEVEYHAGGGLVAASVVAREIDETELKARVFLDAVAALGDPTAMTEGASRVISPGAVGAGDASARPGHSGVV